MVKKSKLRTADALLELFCKQVEEWCGREHCSPNMHLHLHLLQTFIDYGPAHATWCFAFEHYNGMLGAISINKHLVEIQFMQRFIHTQRVSYHYKKIADTEML